MGDILGIILSFVFVGGVIGAATVLLRRSLVSPFAARKIVHIGVSNWWLLMMVFIRDPGPALVAPAAFVVLNWISLRKGLFKAMEDPGSSRSYGTVYFPISLIILAALVWLGFMPRWQAGLGVLVMGWGDGLAALVGKRYGRRRAQLFGSAKSVAGVLAMFAASFVLALAMSAVFDPGAGTGVLLPAALATALFAAFVELATPLGLDNLSVPILTALFFRFIGAPGEGGSSAPFASGPLAFSAALLFNALVAAAAFRLRAVDAGGAMAGTAVGTALLAGGGPEAYFLLMAFFLSSTLIGRFNRARLSPNRVEAKGDRRDALQVLANCGPATLALLLNAATGSPAALGAFAAGFASSNADTWAGEIGIRSKKPPHDLITGAELPAGASGGVTALGFAASILGAAFIGAAFVLAYGRSLQNWMPFAVIVAAGFAGSLLDSLLGATCQAQFACSKTGALTERPTTDGSPNTLTRGLRWITNDTVNFVSSLAATAVAGLVFAFVA